MDKQKVKETLVAYVGESLLSKTPAEVLGWLKQQMGMSRRESRLFLSEVVDDNLLSYRQVLGRTVVVRSLNRYHDLAPGVVVAPPQLPPSPHHPQTLFMEEGISFGNGTHPTTRMCAQYFMGLFSKGHHFGEMLDLGCGTGVLSVLGLLLGATHCDATEIDSVAMHDARVNARFNQVEKRLSLFHADEFSPQKRYTTISANLRTPTLLSLFPQLTRWADPGGQLILSGIQKGEEAKLIDLFCPNFTLEQQIEDRKWVGLHFKKATSFKTH
ncbi:MAG: 50S ribosomal protein L11 methyltransferase [Desulfobacterales bacterium]|nr:50S ribosomal protein L11 methyltransferase [Desulfobacterales bacterium]